ncbi:ABC transporter substrate-binding protein [Microtetraspora sp. NBRC 16547]|uniref:ABC transporter substrate-binding protein n=1 Tax=Microtetraspora sp. NBRC 16547 TaxID=3030993 RepID=UPI0024A49D05|nr:ABC transporter substrate-binding protein [Microtetraspora sp. NBRC 16547]GLX02562.1 glutathione ABC transporter substrate-binding protein [Microtetraspora sp. NBRC 16547]
MTPPPFWSRRRFLGLLPAASLVAACSPASPASGGGTLRIGVAAGPSNLNPLDSGSEVTRWIAEPVMETLYDYDERLRSVPLLAAAEPAVSGDGLTWRIPLKQGVTFHNGDAFTAEHVVASLDHVAAFASGSEWVVYFLGYYSGARAVDRNTVEITLKRPYGLLRSHLTNLPITHRAFADRKDTMMGTGPYKLERVSPGLGYSMAAHHGYHGQPPAYARLEFQIIPDGSTRAVNLRAGNVDIATELPVAALTLLMGQPQVTVHRVDAPIDILTYVKAGDPPFDDVNFRRAVAYASDRQGVNEKVFGGSATLGQGPIGPAERGYDPSLRVFPARPDPARARRLLDGVANPSFTLTISAGQVMEDIAQILVQGWAQAGITVKLEVLQGGPWAQRWISGAYQMIMNRFSSGFTSGDANYLALSPAQSRSVLACGYENAAVDTALDRVWATSDQAERDGLLRQVNAALTEDAVMFPPVYPKMIVGQRASVSPLDPGRMRISRLGTPNLRPGGNSGG